MKIIAADHPRYLPDIFFFHKMARAEVFVLADDLQFSRHGLINRCRIKTVTGASWLTAPVLTKGRGVQSIREVTINNALDWQRQHWRAFEVNYRRTPYFLKYADLLAEFYERPFERLLDLNVAAIQMLCGFLNLNTTIRFTSEFPARLRGTQRVAHVVRQLEGNVYLAAGSDDWNSLKPEVLERANIEVCHAAFTPPVYHQAFGDFVHELSILDLLFNEGDEYFSAWLPGLHEHSNPE